MKMKKSLSVFLTVIAFLTVSCSNWMKDDDFYNKIDYDVKVANAASVSAYVRFANSKMGTTDPSGSIVLKEDIPAQLIAVTNDDYGFVRWAAFSTKDFPSDKQHSDLFYESAEKYAQNFKSKELPASEVTFEDPTNPTTTVTINTTRSDIFIMPLVANRPSVVTSVPSNGRTDVVKNSQVRILFSKPLDEKSLTDEFGNSNIVVTSGSAVLTESSSELGAKDITENFNFTLSKTKKMLTISAKKDSQGKAFLFDSNSQITIKIYEDVCDTDGYNMNGKYSFSFTTGTKQDSLAPFIDVLKAGIGEECLTWNQYTGGASEIKDYQAKAELATNNLNDYTSSPILTQRVKDKINIYVKATDIAGSGGNVDIGDPNVLSESSVAAIQVRASLYIDKNGNRVTTSAQAFPDNSIGTDSTSVRSVRDFGYAMGLMDTDCAIKTKTFEDIISTPEGTIFTYELSSIDENGVMQGLDDGLIKIDVWAVDMVGNSGDSERYVSDYGNGYRSFFVVKDTTAPDSAAAKSKVNITSKDEHDNNPAPYGWYNSNALSHMKIQDKKDDLTANLIKDLNNEYLSSDMNKLEWAFKLGSDSNWKPSANAANIWSKIHNNNQPVVKAMSDAAVSSDGPVYITMCLKDDMGNVSAPVVLDAINYDNTAPVVSPTVNWVKEVVNPQTSAVSYEDVVATTDKTNLSLSGHILKIPFEEVTAGLRRIKVSVNKRGSNGQYETTSAATQEGWTIEYIPNAGTARDLTFVATGSTNEEKLLNVTDTNKVTSGTLYISGIKIGSDTGTYRVTVEMWDSSLNKSTTTSEISIDNTAPVIKKMYIPGLKQNKTVTSQGEVTTATTDGWHLPREWIRGSNGATSANSIEPGFIPLYIFVEEKDSGVQKIEFDSSESGKDNVELYNSSTAKHGKTKLWKIEKFGQADESRTEIPATDYTIDTTAKTITLNNDKTLKSSNEFVILVENIGFDDCRTDLNKIKVKLYDLATLPSNQQTTITPVLGKTDVINGVLSDSYFDVSTTIFTLVDRGYDATNGTTLEAQTGFTNEDIINLNVELKGENSSYSSNSGYNRIKITGAKFIEDSDPTKATTVKVGSKTIGYKLSQDKTEITFMETTQSGAFTGVYAVMRNGITLTISNIKLDSNTEESHTVKVNAYDLTGWGWDLDSIEKSITLDTRAPEWNGKGLYSYYVSDLNANKVYPHPKSNQKVYGLTFDGNDNDLYFFKSDTINIGVDIKTTEKNLYKIRRAAVDHDTYIDSVPAGTYSVFVYDKAGNKSSALNLHVVSDTTFDTNSTAIDNLMTISTPEGDNYARVFTKNKVVRQRRWNPTSGEFNETTGDLINVYDYVIKKNTTNPYIIRIKLGSGIDGSENTSDVLIDGTKASADRNAYVTFGTDGKPALSKTVTPIEYYSVSHWYRRYSCGSGQYFNEPYIPKYPEEWSSNAKCDWREYKKGTTRAYYAGDTSLYSYVDNNGDIIIELPKDKDCPPLSILLKDACGNVTYRNIKPSTLPQNETICWIADGEIGTVLQNGWSYYDWGASETYDIINPGDDVIFYKQYQSKTNLVTYGGEGGLEKFTDSCRFGNVSVDPVEDPTHYSYFETGAGNAAEYSMRSRIIAWPADTAAPGQSAFYLPDGSENASEWCYQKEQSDNKAMTLSNYLPEYNSINAQTGEGKPYNLYYIIEDYVGNFKVRQLAYVKNTNNKFLYDNVEPSVDVQDSTNVNNIDNKNYYSNSSKVKYKIIDKMSGIKNKGTGDMTYPGFSNREKEYTPSGEGESLTAFTRSGSTIYIQNVKDYANNVAGQVGLKYNGSSEWIYQPDSPAFASTSPVQITAVNPPSGKRFNVDPQNGEWYIDSSRKITHIQLKMTMADSEPLLGWIIKNDDTVPENRIYTVADTQSKNNNPPVLTQISNSNKVYTYAIDKTKTVNNTTYADENTTWNDYFNKKPLKFYAVNRAGLINMTPVVINFTPRPVPSIDGSLEYSSDIKKYPSTNSTDNYIKSGSKLIFKTTENPQKCYIIIGQNSVEFTLSSYLNSTTGKYEIPLGIDNKLKAASGSSLKLVLQIMDGDVEGEDSGEIDLPGPAGKNKWTFDENPPAITVASVKTVKSGGNTEALTNQFDTTDKAYYIEGDNAIIALNTTATDVAKWQKKLSTEADSAYSDFSLTNGTITLAAQKTYNFRAIDKAGNISEVLTVELKKDVSAPNGSSFTYSLMKGTAAANGNYYSDNNGTINYNPTEVNTVRVILTGVTDPDGNGLHFYKKVGENSATEITPTESEGVKYHDVSLSTTNNTTATFTISVKDNVGKTTVLKTFTVTADQSAPVLTLATSNPVQTESTGSVYYKTSNSTYYIRGDKAIVNFTKTVNDIREYQWKKEGDTDYTKFETKTSLSTVLTVDDNNGTVKFEFPISDGSIKYYFRAVDKVGNVGDAKTVTIKQAKANPDGSISQYSVNGTKFTQNAQGNYESTGDFFTKENTETGIKIVTITYTASATTLTITPGTITDNSETGAFIVYNDGTTESEHYTTAFDITLGSTAKTYSVYVKDNVGNSKLLQKFELKPHSTAPVANYTGNWSFDSVANTNAAAYAPLDKTLSGDHNGYHVLIFRSGTQLKFKVTTDMSVIFYCLGKKNSSDTSVSYYNTWKAATVSNGEIILTLDDSNMPVAGSVQSSLENDIYLKFKDCLGIECSAPGQLKWNDSIGWWSIDATGPEFDCEKISVKKSDNNNADGYWKKSVNGNNITITYNSTVAKTLDLSAAFTDDNVGSVQPKYKKTGGTETNGSSITLADGDVYEVWAIDKFENESVHKTITFTEDITGPNIANITVGTPKFFKDGNEVNSGYNITGDGPVVIKYNSALTKCTISITTTESNVVFHKFADGQDRGEFNGEISLGNNATIVIKAIDDLGNATTVKEYQFTVDNSIQISQNKISTASAFSGLIDTSKLAGARDLAATQISAAQSAGIKLNKDIESGSVADGLVKNAKVSKKAAKKAAKAAKAAAKATAKAAKEAPAVQEIELQDAFVDSVVNENIPISEQIIKDDIYQITAKTEFVMGGIEPGETNESIVSAIAQEENSSSKTALWIVLCALCAAAAGLVVCLKKKRG